MMPEYCYNTDLTSLFFIAIAIITVLLPGANTVVNRYRLLYHLVRRRTLGNPIQLSLLVS